MSSSRVRMYDDVESNDKVVNLLNTRSREVLSTSEMQMTSNEWFSCSSAETLFSYLDEERASEKEDMLQLNQKLGEQVGRLHRMESEEVFIEIITNIKDFAELFRTLLGGERTEIERLKDKIKTIEVERSRVSENLVKLNVEKEELVGTVKQLKQTVEKTSNDVLLLREENQKLKVECATLTESRQVQERKVISLQEELQYARENINTKDNEIGRLIGGQSGISIFVSLERSLKDATASIQQKYDEHLKKIQLSYKTRMAEENMCSLLKALNAWSVRLRKAQGDEVDGFFGEVDRYRKEIDCLKKQLESQSMYIQSLQSCQEEYKQWSEERLGEFKENVSLMGSYLRKYIQTNVSLKLEIDKYRFELERLEKRYQDFLHNSEASDSTSIKDEVEDISWKHSIPEGIEAGVDAVRESGKVYGEHKDDEYVDNTIRGTGNSTSIKDEVEEIIGTYFVPEGIEPRVIAVTKLREEYGERSDDE